MSLALARELAVLSVLAAHPAHGYEIAKALTAGPLAHLGLSRPAVYAILERFRARGWLDEAHETGGPYPDRTVLSLTDLARAALSDRLARVGEDSLPPTLPLLSVLMSLDCGASLPPAAIDRLIAARERLLNDWTADDGHSGSAAGRLARRVVEAELAVLAELRARGDG